MSLIRNTPSADGYALGEQLARFCEQQIDAQQASGRAVPRRCDTCAFRKGTVPNGCAATVMDALKCVLEGDTVFHCHERGTAEEPPICAGYLLLARPDNGTRTPWAFSDERDGGQGHASYQ